MHRLLIGCAALTLFAGPAAAQYYGGGGGYYQEPRYQEHYVAPKPKPYYQQHYVAPKPRPYYEPQYQQREYYSPPPSYGGQYNPRY